MAEREAAFAARVAEEAGDSADPRSRSRVQTATTEEWKRIEKLPFVAKLTEAFEGRVVDVRSKDDG
jgi:hypothetical protein